MATFAAVLFICASLVAADRSNSNDRFSSGSSVSGNGGFGSGNSNRFGGSDSDRFGSSNTGSNSDRFGSSGSGTDTDRFGSSGSGSDRSGGSGSRITNPSVDSFGSGSGSGNDWDSDDDMDTQRINAWPGGVVPYTIGSDISDSNARTLKQMLDDLSSQTCVQFVTRVGRDANYTLFKSGNVCSAPLGMSNHPTADSDSSMGSGSRSGSGSSRDNFGSSSRGISTSNRGSSLSNGVSGASNVVLASSCFQTKRLARRLMNLLGIPHETSRPDRDQFVTINSNNIRTGYTKNLQQLSKSAYLPGVLDIPYDLQSVTQYSDDDLAKDKKTWAIRPKSSRLSARDIGGDNFSKADIQKINAAYNCRSSGSGSRGSFGSSQGTGSRRGSGSF